MEKRGGEKASREEVVSRMRSLWGEAPQERVLPVKEEKIAQEESPLVLTEEQAAVVASRGDIKINAVAGSGKTTTVIEYAKSRERTAKILYIAFNKSVKEEAKRKFLQEGLNNVKVETAHSLAYGHTIPLYRYKVRSQGYRSQEIAELLKIKGGRERHWELIVANHVRRLTACFCNSDKATLRECDYRSGLEEESVWFFKFYQEAVFEYAQRFLSLMEKGEIEVTHDFYLKKFHLDSPSLGYDILLFDEAQDASGAMLGVFQKQKGVKVVVGDTNQQIYGWRYAVNSLESLDYTPYSLSTSFRFPQEIADLAVEVLKEKSYLGFFKPPSIRGRGTGGNGGVKAVLARTNLGLLLKAIDYLEERCLSRLYFEGNIHSYTYAEEGASLYDVLSLFNGKPSAVHDPVIKRMRDLAELEEYISMTGEIELALMVEIVKKYGNGIPGILRSLKDKHVGDQEKERAEYIFSTVHRAKGMEYDEVHLAEDFMTEERLMAITGKGKELEPAVQARLREEINLLYVAVTRARHRLYIPENLLPQGVEPSSAVRTLRPWKEKRGHAEESLPAREERREGSFFKGTPPRKRAAPVKKGASRSHGNFTDQELVDLYLQGKSVQEIAKGLGSPRDVVLQRMQTLGMF